MTTRKPDFFYARTSSSITGIIKDTLFARDVFWDELQPAFIQSEGVAEVASLEVIAVFLLYLQFTGATISTDG